MDEVVVQEQSVVSFPQVAELSHTDRVTSVAFNPKGRFLASGSWDKTVRIWEVSTQQQVAELSHTGSVTSVAYDPSGKYLASGSGNEIVIWEVGTQKQVTVLRGHTNYVTSVAFDPRGKYLASGSNNNSVRLWDVRTWEQLAELTSYSQHDATVRSGMDALSQAKQTTGLVNSVAFDPMGRFLASASVSGVHNEEGVVRIWDIIYWEKNNKWNMSQKKTETVMSVAFNPSGKLLEQQLASGSNDIVRIFNARIPEASLSPLVLLDDAELRGHTSTVMSVAFYPRGRFLASGSYSAVRIWDVDAQQQLAELTDKKMKYVMSVAFDPMGRFLASGCCGDNTVRVWDVSQLQLLQEQKKQAAASAAASAATAAAAEERQQRTLDDPVKTFSSLFSSPLKTKEEKSVMKAHKLINLKKEVKELKIKLAKETNTDNIGKLQLKINELTGRIDLLEDDLNVSQLQQLQEPPPPAASADKLYWQEQWENHRKYNHSDDPYDFLGGYKRSKRQRQRSKRQRQRSKRQRQRSKRQRQRSKRRQSKRRQGHKK
jgi:WD40 repeat protein